MQRYDYATQILRIDVYCGMKSFQNRFLTIVHFAIGILIFWVASYVFTSCHKENLSSNPPIVKIVKPTENKVFSTLDTIEAVVSITHDRTVNSLWISLLDEEYTPLGVEERYTISATNISSTTFQLPINKPLWSSGTFYISARASDGENVGTDYVKIKLNAIERKIDRYVVVTRHNFKTNIYVGSDFDSIPLMAEMSMDLKGAAFNFKQNILGLAGGEVGDAKFLQLPEFNEIQSIPGYGNPSVPYFQSLNYSTGQSCFFLTDNQPILTILNQNAEVIASFLLTPYFLPGKTFTAGEYIFVYQKNITSPEHRLGQYLESGYLKGNHVIFSEVKNVTKKSEHSAFVWSDTDEGARLEILDYTTNGFAEVFTRLNETLYDVVEINSGNFIFSTNTGLYRYVYGGGTSILNNSLVLKSLYYDDLNEFIYGVNQKELYQLSFFGDLIQNITYPHDIALFAIDYNR